MPLIRGYVRITSECCLKRSARKNPVISHDQMMVIEAKYVGGDPFGVVEFIEKPLIAQRAVVILFRIVPGQGQIIRIVDLLKKRFVRTRHLHFSVFSLTVKVRMIMIAVVGSNDRDHSLIIDRAGAGPLGSGHIQPLVFVSIPQKPVLLAKLTVGVSADNITFIVDPRGSRRFVRSDIGKFAVLVEEAVVVARWSSVLADDGAGRVDAGAQGVCALGVVNRGALAMIETEAVKHSALIEVLTHDHTRVIQTISSSCCCARELDLLGFKS